jgi:putative membrane protein
MKTFVGLILSIVAVATVGCGSKGTGYDTSPSEYAEGDNNRRSAMTNAEAGMDSTMKKVPEQQDVTKVMEPNKTKLDSGEKVISPKTTEAHVSADYRFILDAAEAGLTEIKLSKLAVEKAKSSKVKNAAEMIVKDHTAANQELTKLVAGRGMTLPADCKKCGDKYDELKDLKGEKFDAKYEEMMLDGHKDAIATFKQESRLGGDPAVAKWANDKLSTLEHHLSMFQSIDKNDKKSEKAKKGK